MQDFEYDVFLSYNSIDRPVVHMLAQKLQAAGLKIWFDQWSVGAGKDIFQAVEEGLAASRFLVLCMSPAAFRSGWVTMERNTILFRDPANTAQRFIPLLLADCDIPAAIKRFKHIDYRNREADAIAELLAVIRGQQKRPLRQASPSPLPEPSPTSALVDRTTVEIKEFLLGRFAGEAAFDDLCRELGITNSFAGNFDSRITSLIQQLERQQPQPVELLYAAVVKLRPGWKVVIERTFRG